MKQNNIWNIFKQWNPKQEENYDTLGIERLGHSNLTDTLAKNFCWISPSQKKETFWMKKQ